MGKKRLHKKAKGRDPKRFAATNSHSLSPKELIDKVCYFNYKNVLEATKWPVVLWLFAIALPLLKALFIGFLTPNCLSLPSMN